jgi:hypothetical protein
MGHGPASQPQGHELHDNVLQTGSSLNGTWSDNFTHGGSITGSKNGTNVNITLNGNASSCSVSYTGTVDTLTQINGTLAGIDCVINTGGQFTLTKS